MLPTILPFLLGIALAILSFFWFYLSFRITFSSSVKNVGIWIGIALNLNSALGDMAILMILILLIQKQVLSFHCLIAFFNLILQSFTVFILQLFYLLRLTEG